MNFLAILVAAIAAMVIGTIWYNPKVFGTAWIKDIGMTQEQAESGNMLKIFGFAFLFSFILAFVMPTIVNHQFGATALVGGEFELANAKPSYFAFMKDYGNAFRSFKHGALHGFGMGLFFAFPILGITAMFEHRSWKYIFIHAGYFIVSLTVVGAIICGWV
jgi:Protein of unknown function (DUF1761)